jgi:hypothetical protein
MVKVINKGLAKPDNPIYQRGYSYQLQPWGIVFQENVQQKPAEIPTEETTKNVEE